MLTFVPHLDILVAAGGQTYLYQFINETTVEVVGLSDPVDCQMPDLPVIVTAFELVHLNGALVFCGGLEPGDNR